MWTTGGSGAACLVLISAGREHEAAANYHSFLTLLLLFLAACLHVSS